MMPLEVNGVIIIMEKLTIITLLNKGESYRQIAKALGMDRKTVAKYCNAHKMELATLKAHPQEARNLQERMLAPPNYNSSERKSRKYNSEIDLLLNEILSSETQKDKLLGSTHKQGLTNEQILKIIHKAGFDIGKTTICNKLREKRDFIKECFIRQEYEYADRLEFDFGEVILMINDQRNKYHMAVLSSPASGFRWAYLYKSQKKEVFQSAHVDFFEMVGGVYREVVYDNMKNVVSKFIGKHEKELNQDLINLSMYYGFSINVTNAFSGNEKGHVEGSVKVIRNAIYGPKYKFESFEEAKEHLQNELVLLNKDSEIEREKKHLNAYKPKLDLARIRIVTINKYGFARINHGSYSVPDFLVGKKLKAKMYHDTIDFYSHNNFVCRHRITDDLNAVSIDIRHYLTTFKRKPGAIKNSLALKSMPRLKSIYDTYFSASPKDFIALLEHFKELDFDALIEHLREHCKRGESIRKNESIALLTTNQLSLYNTLAMGRRH